MGRDLYHASSYDYYLPECDIAQRPAIPRDSSRLLVLDVDRPPGSPSGMNHREFRDLPDILSPGDCLVLNNTRVRRARLRGFRAPGGGLTEILILSGHHPGYRALMRPARRIREGTRIWIPPREVWDRVGQMEPHHRVESAGKVGATVRIRKDEGEGVYAFSVERLCGVEDLEELGELPLPPYVLRAPPDTSRYQTVYARESGSAAAPTAGLHFTPRLLRELRAMGVVTPTVVLHVGQDTFRPLRGGDVRSHDMHSEWLEVSREAVEQIRAARARGGRVIAVGTTAVRSLETAARDGRLRPYTGQTDLYIYPGYRFRVVDGLITNFHLPKSTLLLLVSALAGRDRILGAYREARRRNYRFYSFGDAMYIKPSSRGENSE
ncbi:MAG: tRNA preQ1(34) S-adenosylmethionine ribosyltransferase-isomerase QueA [Clostridia bacterium]